MSLISLLVVILVLVVIGWILFTYVFPRLPEPIRTIVIIICAIIAIVILLGFIGIGPGVGILR